MMLGCGLPRQRQPALINAFLGQTGLTLEIQPP
jgi:hypothetical protein